VGSNISELASFCILFRHAALSAAEVAGFETLLHQLLASEMDVEHFPWGPRRSPLTTLDVIFFKYTVARQQKLGVGKKLSQAITSKTYNHLNLPTLIYATRNWNIHGVLISSSFRGPSKKFNVWIDTINLALAKILEGAADALKKAI
jgi:hypothetical protein